MNQWIESLSCFVDELKKKERSHNTVSKYARDVKKLQSFLRERQLSKDEVHKFKEELTHKYKISSVNSMIAAVNVYLKFIGRPDCTVSKIKVQRSQFRPNCVELQNTELVRLIETANSDGMDQTSTIVKTLAETGVRVSELKFFKVESLESNVIEVMNKGKSRLVVMSERTIKTLKDYCLRNNITHGRIFTNKHGKPVTRQSVWKQLKDLSAKSGVDAKKLFPHNLRHAFAKNFYMKTKNIVALATLLGHQSIDTTKRYIQQTLEEVRAMLSDATPNFSKGT